MRRGGVPLLRLCRGAFLTFLSDHGASRFSRRRISGRDKEFAVYDGDS